MDQQIPIARLLRRKLIFIPSAIVALAVAATATAVGTQFFGGGDDAVPASVSTTYHAGPAVTHDGITISVTGVAADDTRTVVGLSVEGRPSIGAGVMPAGQAKLIDGSGHVYAETGGTSDQSDPRLVSRYYPPLPSDVKAFTVEINGLQFMNRGDSAGVVVDDQWQIPVTLDSGPAASTNVVVSHAPQPFGRGSVVADRVQQALTGTVISAHLEGFSMEEISQLSFRATLTTADGMAQTPVGFEAGFGEGRKQLEIRFAKTTGNATLSLTGVLDDPHPQNPALSAKLAKEFADSTPAHWSLTLP